MKETIEFKLTPFEEFMNSIDDGCEPNELELFAEMTDSYMEMSEIIQEGKILDAATGKGENEKTWVKVIKFIPRLVKALVRALLNKINKNKIKIKELDKALEELKKDNEKLKEDNAELKRDLENEKVVSNAWLSRSTKAEYERDEYKNKFERADKLQKQYASLDNQIRVDQTKAMEKIKLRYDINVYSELREDLKDLEKDAQRFDFYVEKIVEQVSLHEAETRDDIKEIFDHFLSGVEEFTSISELTKKVNQIKNNHNPPSIMDFYEYACRIINLHKKYEDIVKRIDQKNDTLTEKLQKLAEGKEETEQQFGYEPLSDSQVKIIKDLLIDYFKRVNSIRDKINWFFQDTGTDSTFNPRKLGKASDDYMK